MSRNLHFLLFTAIIVVAAEKKKITFCNLQSCKVPGSHTFCKYSPSTMNASNCGVVKSFTMTDNEKDEILKLHNELREKVKRGEEKRGLNGPQPAATMMNNLRWNNKLAKIAQAWAYQCIFDHDDCRDTQMYTVGQNIGAKAEFLDYVPNALSIIVKLWYDEVEHFNNQEVPYFTAATAQETGHYTQLIWADTKYIGCAVIRFKSARSYNMYRTYLVCNYAPAGNVMRASVYPVARET